LIAAERNIRRFWVHFDRALTSDRTIPAPVLAQTWRGPRSARIALLLRSCVIEPLDESLAKEAGELLARAGTADAIDAIVVASAARRRDVILTSDAADLRRLAAAARGRVTVIAI
jgi:predicted nucleic acid-binding protein